MIAFDDLDSFLCSRGNARTRSQNDTDPPNQGISNDYESKSDIVRADCASSITDASASIGPQENMHNEPTERELTLTSK